MSTLRLSEITSLSGAGNISVTGGKLISPGSLLQVKQTVMKSTFSSSIGNGWANVSDLDCSITPISASSNILVRLGLIWGTQYYQCKVRLMKNSQVVAGALGNIYGSRGQSWMTLINYVGGEANAYYNTYSGIGEYLDIAGTSSTITYGIQIGGYSTSYAVYVNRSHQYQNSADYDFTPVSTMTLMEIATE
jgi:hypothetical protein